MPVVVRPRPRNAAATRQAMLQAAHARFLRENYENVGMRDIAGDVGVDVALVSRYFGSKEKLFREVLRSDKGDKFRIAIDPRDFPAYLTSLVTQDDDGEDAEHLERLLIILRSASSPQAAAIIRDAVHEDVFDPMIGLIGGDHADLRASFAMAVLMGTAILRTIMRVEPLCEDCDEGAIAERLTRLFETALKPG